MASIDDFIRTTTTIVSALGFVFTSSQLLASSPTHTHASPILLPRVRPRVATASKMRTGILPASVLVVVLMLALVQDGLGAPLLARTALLESGPTDAEQLVPRTGGKWLSFSSSSKTGSLSRSSSSSSSASSWSSHSSSSSGSSSHSGPLSKHNSSPKPSSSHSDDQPARPWPKTVAETDREIMIAKQALVRATREKNIAERTKLNRYVAQLEQWLLTLRQG